MSRFSALEGTFLTPDTSGLEAHRELARSCEDGPAFYRRLVDEAVLDERFESGANQRFYRVGRRTPELESDLRIDLGQNRLRLVRSIFPDKAIGVLVATHSEAMVRAESAARRFAADLWRATGRTDPATTVVWRSSTTRGVRALPWIEGLVDLPTSGVDPPGRWTPLARWVQRLDHLPVEVTEGLYTLLETGLGITSLNGDCIQLWLPQEPVPTWAVPPEPPRTTDVLMQAIRSLDVETVRRALEAGADVQQSVAHQGTPLGAVATAYVHWHADAEAARREIVRLLLAAGAPPGWSGRLGVPLLTFNRDARRSLLDAGVPIDARDARGRTALHAAAQSGNLEMLNEFLEAGATVDSVDELGMTPLELAQRTGQLYAVERLMEAGADPLRVRRPAAHVEVPVAMSRGPEFGPLQDWLQARGDPRGHMLALQAAGLKEDAADLQHSTRAFWRTQLASVSPGVETMLVDPRMGWTFVAGFPTRLLIPNTTVVPSGALRDLFSSGLGGMLVDLTAWVDAGVLQELVEVPQLPLQTLDLRFGEDPVDAVVVASIVERCPHLHTLRLTGLFLEDLDLAHPDLRSLTIVVPRGGAGRPLVGLDTPGLKSLHLEFGTPPTGDTPLLQVMRTLPLPARVTLLPATPELLLAIIPQLEQVSQLTLRCGWPVLVDSLERHAEHLQHLELRATMLRLDKAARLEAQQRLDQVLPNVTVKGDTPRSMGASAG